MCIKTKTRYDISMGKASIKFRAPDVEKDRKRVIKESKCDLQDLMENSAPLDNLTALADALKNAKERREKP